MTDRASEGESTAWPLVPLVPLGSAAALDRYFAHAADLAAPNRG